MTPTEAAIRDLLNNSIDIAAVATLTRCTFREVQELKAIMEIESYEAARKKSATAMHTLSPALEASRAKAEKAKAMRRKMREHARQSHATSPGAIRVYTVVEPESENTFREME